MWKKLGLKIPFLDLMILGWLGAMGSVGGFWTKENCSTEEERDEDINIIDGEEGGVELSRKWDVVRRKGIDIWGL